MVSPSLFIPAALEKAPRFNSYRIPCLGCSSGHIQHEPGCPLGGGDKSSAVRDTSLQGTTALTLWMRKHFPSAPFQYIFPSHITRKDPSKHLTVKKYLNNLEVLVICFRLSVTASRMIYFTAHIIFTSYFIAVSEIKRFITLSSSREDTLAESRWHFHHPHTNPYL